MREKNIIIIAIVIILLCVLSIGAYFLTQNNYKNITMSGMTLEVPNSDTEVENVSENYNRYNDTKNNLTIQSWHSNKLNDSTDINTTNDMGAQLWSNIGFNSTYDNVSVYNKSGIYTYYDCDTTKGALILITGSNVEDVTHAVKTLKKSNISLVDGAQNYLDSMNLSLNDTQNSTDSQANVSSDNSASNSANQVSTDSKKESSDNVKSASSKSSSSKKLEVVNTVDNENY